MLSHVQLFASLLTVARQAPLSMGLFRQEFWSGLPCPFPGDLPDPGVKPAIPKLEADSLPIESLGKPIFKQYCKLNICYQCVNVSFPFLSQFTTTTQCLIAFSEIKSVGEIKSLGKESIMMILHIVICKAVRTKLHKSVKGQLLYELSQLT